MWGALILVDGGVHGGVRQALLLRRSSGSVMKINTDSTRAVREPRGCYWMIGLLDILHRDFGAYILLRKIKKQ